MIIINKIVLLFGGTSSEHDVSINSFKNIYKYIDKKKYLVSNIYITKENNWIECDYDEVNSLITYNKKIINIINYLKKYDCVFPILHGINGEDGNLQGLFEMFGIPYIGCDSISSKVCLNKCLSKIVFDYFNIPQIPFIIFNKNDNIDELNVEYPVIVKPSNGGSSIGISVANNSNELKESISFALQYDENIIIEKFIKARELEVAVYQNNDINISSIGEIKYNSLFYDYETKYFNNKSELLIPSKINEDIKNKIINISLYIFNKLNCKDIARIDFLYDEDNNILYLNEINTIPGFTNTSMYIKLLEYDGNSINYIINELIEKNKR